MERTLGVEYPLSTQISDGWGSAGARTHDTRIDSYISANRRPISDPNGSFWSEWEGGYMRGSFWLVRLSSWNIH
jgi:hypothetical protein